MIERKQKNLFQIGEVTIHPLARAALEASSITPDSLLRRHGKGDWGVIHESQRQQNEENLRNKVVGFISAYIIDTGDCICIMTCPSGGTLILHSKECWFRIRDTQPIRQDQDFFEY